VGLFGLVQKMLLNASLKLNQISIDFLNNLSGSPGSGDPVPGYEGKIFKER
jgi:hypothetical protein